VITSPGEQNFIIIITLEEFPYQYLMCVNVLDCEDCEVRQAVDRVGHSPAARSASVWIEEIGSEQAAAAACLCRSLLDDSTE